MKHGKERPLNLRPTFLQDGALSTGTAQSICGCVSVCVYVSKLTAHCLSADSSYSYIQCGSGTRNATPL